MDLQGWPWDWHRVVAEGVETIDELSRWIHLGGQLVQGYLYSRPVDFEALLVVLSRGELLHVPGRVFAVEDFLLLNDALVVEHLDQRREESSQVCAFFDWFAIRSGRWGELASFATSAAMHEQLHRPSGVDESYHALASHWVSHVKALRDDIANCLR